MPYFKTGGRSEYDVEETQSQDQKKWVIAHIGVNCNDEADSAETAILKSPITFPSMEKPQKYIKDEIKKWCISKMARIIVLQ